MMVEIDHELSQFIDKPSTLDVLRILAAAGSDGILAPVIARCFRLPESQQARNAWVNQILKTLTHKNRAARSNASDKSPYYYNVPTYRWYIIDAGRSYLAAGGMAGLVEIHQHETEKSYNKLQDKVDRHSLILKAAPSLVQQLPPGCTAARRNLITQLRDRGLTLRELGQLFGISGERVRQVNQGIRVAPCRCGQCR